jgi:copper(I)-binding protein
MRWPEIGALLLNATIVPMVAGAAGPAGPVELSRPWAAPAALGGDTSVMFQVQNYGPVRDDLILAGCATAESADLMGPGPNGGPPVRLTQLGLGPGQSLALTPGGVHLVLHHLQRAARVGDTLHCTATFGKSGERLFEAEVSQDEPAIK